MKFEEMNQSRPIVVVFMQYYPAPVTNHVARILLLRIEMCDKHRFNEVLSIIVHVVTDAMPSIFDFEFIQDLY
jgi:hypothetical protein